MESCLNSKFTQVAVGVAGIIISVATAAFGSYYQTPVLEILRPIELVASGLLIFGILKRHHILKPQIVLIWLACSLLFTCGMFHTFWAYSEMGYVNAVHPEMKAYVLAMAGVMSGMMYVMYNAYVQLIDGADDVKLLAY
ncbi:hypothetical protein KR018_011723 [Drosophila ironensis]|nr:hypothetical protein KR018_011723 [Drosophila ironensis]